jgi:hypothetical protein
VYISIGIPPTANGGTLEPVFAFAERMRQKLGQPNATRRLPNRLRFFDAALRLLETAPARIETRSKAERGYRLLGSAGLPQVVHVGPVTPDPAIAVEAAVQYFGRQCLPHLLRPRHLHLDGLRLRRS